MIPSTRHPRESGDLAVQRANRYQTPTKTTPKVLSHFGETPKMFCPKMSQKAAL